MKRRMGWTVKLAAAVLLLSACNEPVGDPAATPASPLPSPTQAVSPSEAQPPPVGDAEQFRDVLLDIAREVPATNMSDYDPYDGWREAFPDLEFLGRDEPATEQGVSVIGVFFALDDKEVVGPENPLVLSFAVADTVNRCAGAYIAAIDEGAPPTIFQPVDMTGLDCTAVAAFPESVEV